VKIEFIHTSPISARLASTSEKEQAQTCQANQSHSSDRSANNGSNRSRTASRICCNNERSGWRAANQGRCRSSITQEVRGNWRSGAANTSVSLVATVVHQVQRTVRGRGSSARRNSSAPCAVFIRRGFSRRICIPPQSLYAASSHSASSNTVARIHAHTHCKVTVGRFLYSGRTESPQSVFVVNSASGPWRCCYGERRVSILECAGGPGG
jgi:hypothetical protein